MSNNTFYFLLKFIVLVLAVFLLLFVQRFFHFFFLEDLFFKHAAAFYLGLVIPAVFIVLISKYHRWIYKKRLEFILLGVVSLIGILAIEGTLRIMDDKPLRLGGHHYLNHHGAPNFISKNGTDMHNSLGFRGEEVITPKPEKVFRVVALGGSTTYTTGVSDWKKAYPHHLQQALRDKFQYESIEVINAGIHSYTTFESLINLQIKILDMEPDMIIIYHGINDIAARVVDPEAYMSDNGGSRKQFKEPFCLYPKCSAIWSRLIGEVGRLPIGAETDYYKKENADGLIEELGISVENVLEKNSPIYFKRNLESIISIALTHDITPLLVTWSGSNRAYMKKEYIQKAVEEQNTIIKEIAKESAVQIYDFSEKMSKEEKYWRSDGIHVTELGSKYKAELFSNYIVNSGIIDNEIATLKQTYEREQRQGNKE